MHAALRFRFRHALHSVNATFELERSIDAVAFDEHADFLVATHRAFAQVLDSHLPAHLVAVAAIHAEQVACEKC